MNGKVIGNPALFDQLVYHTEEEADAFVAVIEEMSEAKNTPVFQVAENAGMAQDFVEFGLRLYLKGRQSALPEFTNGGFLKEETNGACEEDS